MPKTTVAFILVLLLYGFAVNAQTLSNPGRGDSLYPVTGGYYQYVDNSSADNYRLINFGLTKANGKYLVNGEFQNWADNNGSALLLDTVSNAIINNRKWRVNGEVRTVVPDGLGGFFIGGEFTAVGDSARKNIAQISASGKPTSWKPVANAAVNVILKRNDTLFIAGAFTTFAGVNRNCFAMCKTSGSMLVSPGFTGFYNINALVLNQDTVVYGGRVQNGFENIRKYSIKAFSQLAWATPFTDFSEVKHLAVTGNTIAYAGDFNGDFIKAVSNGTGAEMFYYSISLGNSVGHVKGLKHSGNKIFACGDFVSQSNASGSGNRRGFFAFDATTGILQPDPEAARADRDVSRKERAVPVRRQPARQDRAGRLHDRLPPDRSIPRELARAPVGSPHYRLGLRRKWWQGPRRAPD